MRLNQHIAAFAQAVGNGTIDIYNEFSLQHELGLYLRSRLTDCKVQFERNVSHFQLAKENFEKREIDLAVTSASGERLSVIELKYPRNGQVPESMYSFCKDIAFLEQLLLAGFQSAYFLAMADDKLFYSGSSEGIYGLFRSGMPITGKIEKPTGEKNLAEDKKRSVKISGIYTASWMPVSGSSKFCLIEVHKPLGA